jgi:hypothetical protein
MSSTDVSTDYVEQFNRAVAEITQPLVEQYENLDRTIKEREVEIVSMRKARTQLRGMLRSINPELVPTVSKNGKRKQFAKDKNVAEHKVVRFSEWLQAHAEEINASGGIHASGIINSNGTVLHDDWDPEIMNNQSALSKAFQMLHDRGIVRLDHRGNGGAKYYKVVV